MTSPLSDIEAAGDLLFRLEAFRAKATRSEGYADKSSLLNRVQDVRQRIKKLDEFADAMKDDGDCDLWDHHDETSRELLTEHCMLKAALTAYEDWRYHRTR